MKATRSIAEKSFVRILAGGRASQHWLAVTVPMGQAVEADDTTTGAGVNLEFLGRDFSEGTLLGLTYAFEQATEHRTTPVLLRPFSWGRRIFVGSANALSGGCDECARARSRSTAREHPEAGRGQKGYP